MSSFNHPPSTPPLFDGPNGTRGWIMCIVSGIACIAGASFICVDILIRNLTSRKTFRIEESNAFLASSLSLSFGVMIYSALTNMLPESKKELVLAGYDEAPAGLVMMGYFVVGFVGIQVLSRLMHRYMPSHVVDCDHTHGDSGAHDRPHHHNHNHHHHHHQQQQQQQHDDHASKPRHSEPHSGHGLTHHNGIATESTPLLPSQAPKPQPAPNGGSRHAAAENGLPHVHTHGHIHAVRPQNATDTCLSRRPSMLLVRDRVISFVKDTKANCDESGPCYGYTDPCGQECFKHMSARTSLSRNPVQRTTTRISSAADLNQDPGHDAFRTPTYHVSRAQSRDLAHAPPYGEPGNQTDDSEDDGSVVDAPSHGAAATAAATATADEDLESQHHHHVPTNAFMSIGLQTVIAIALHKFPEGFITYATNMASPALGFNVFMALFVHNIAEGFSMALPLYMALGSRLKAIAWSSLLGGLTQPAGATLAWLYFKLARRTDVQVDHGAYGAVYAITAGIMTSVALQLFVESLSLSHSRNLSIAFAFIGIVLLGFSSSIYD